MSAKLLGFPQSTTPFALLRNVKGVRSSVNFIVPHRCLHIHSRQKLLWQRHPSNSVTVEFTRVTPLCTVLSRWNSSQASDLPAGYIPDPPPMTIPDPDMTPYVEQLNALGEPTLQSLGLGSYYPAGLVQQGLEWLHVGLDVPWWGAICIATIILRICIFPVMVKAIKSSTNFANHIEDYKEMMEKLNEAKRYGDYYESARLEKATTEYFKEHDLKLRNVFMTPLVQTPIFISVFAGFRGMVYLPVESMKTGGLFWFTDLTVPDPYCILPVLTAATMMLQLELGSETAKTKDMNQYMRWGMRCMPVVVLVMTWNFPAAMLCYWFTSNAFSVLQGMVLRRKSVSKWLKVPERKVQPLKKKNTAGMIEKLKSSWEERKLMQDSKTQQKQKYTSFKKHGSGPITKTYAYDPTKVRRRQIQK